MASQHDLRHGPPLIAGPGARLGPLPNSGIELSTDVRIDVFVVTAELVAVLRDPPIIPLVGADVDVANLGVLVLLTVGERQEYLVLHLGIRPLRVVNDLLVDLLDLALDLKHPLVPRDGCRLALCECVKSRQRSV